MESNVEISEFCSEKPLKPRRLSKEWANDLLRYGINVLDKWWISPTSHKNSVCYKILIVSGFIGQLEREGYWWQSKRLANHLHRYLAGLQAKPDTLEQERERVSP